MIHKQSGLSLIELMISLTLGIVLMTGVTQMFLSSRVTYSTQQAISRIQESGRMAVDFLAHDIRMAGYRGCASSNADIVFGLEGDDDYKYAFDEAIRGYAVDNDGKVEGPDDDEYEGITAEPGSEVLVVRRASGQSVSIAEASNETPDANIKVNGVVDNSCLLEGQLCGDTIGLMTDCTKGRIFRVVGVSNNGGNQTISHSNGGSKPTNLDTKLGGQEFAEGSKLMAYNTIAYYVAESAFSPDGATDVLSLWKKVGEDDPVELIEGVEDMEVHYGFFDGAGSGVPDTYEPLTEMAATDWENVQAVRIHLLLQGMEPNVLQEQQTVFFAGDNVTFDDGRMRQVFSTTIGIRGRIN